MSDVAILDEVDKPNGVPLSTLPPANEVHEPHKAINARNWSAGMKLYHTAIPCFLAFLM
jgi:hypothetical protein